ncbi:MAG: radical SAM protein [Sandaracinaceae bacterium]
MSADPTDASEAELGRMLSTLYEREPRLRPDPQLHDYPLTYPPAVALERDPSAQVPPSEDALLEDGVGDFTGGGLYFHFGFCRYRCRYCFHYELTTKPDVDLQTRYVATLDRAMQRFSRLTSARVKYALYFLGGGTPTALPTDLLNRFLGSLLLWHGRPRTSMSTVEAKPITATDDKLRALVSAGFRRINLGVQTFDPELYAFHHHGESLRVAYDAIERARRAGFEWVNVDLMTGLENQSDGSFDRTLAETERLARTGAIDSCFLYPYHDDPRRKTFGQPGTVPSFVSTAHTDARLRRLMQRLGWKELGARFYRSPRHVRRELLELARVRISPAYGESLYHGYGNSAFSIGDRATYLNHRSAVRYCEDVEAGGLGIASWRTLSARERATRDVSFDLLYSPVTRLRSRSRKYGASAVERHRTLLSRWEALGLGEQHRLLGTFSLSGLGKLVHQQMIPWHYEDQHRAELHQTQLVRLELGRRYRGY